MHVCACVCLSVLLLVLVLISVRVCVCVESVGVKRVVNLLNIFIYIYANQLKLH